MVGVVDPNRSWTSGTSYVICVKFSVEQLKFAHIVDGQGILKLQFMNNRELDQRAYILVTGFHKDIAITRRLYVCMKQIRLLRTHFTAIDLCMWYLGQLS